ncbi:cyclic peptide export ABC transporter [Janthinobacterium fluminis]|uniref:Cyclic peptide export ABC transporter n=1 Tax=Janthinobacterium fluminis TaxID=2987524 RepID=A0ABT5K438_9BURK|nr:cyclic peptide export ABC transporter [Janthinobacterium fluminis]MDC8759694.1 cyclic peptide export ABC transporter [Janthinobacterium fluminis]
MLRFLIDQSKALLIAAALASVSYGVCSVLLIALISEALTTDSAGRGGMAWMFGLLALGLMLSHMAAAVLFERLSQHAHAELRRYVSARVMAADYRNLEATGSAKVQSALSEHSANVAAFFVTFPAILSNLVVVLGCLLYMLLLSWHIFLFAVALIGLGSLGYHLANLRAIRHLNRAAEEQDRLFGYFRSLNDGAKELRLHYGKRKVFTEQILGGSIESVRSERALGMSIFVVSASWANFLIYAFIGLVLFVLIRGVPDEARIMTGFALVFVYMVTPLEVLLLNIPRANLAKASARRIDDITTGMSGREAAAASAQSEPLRQLALEAVVHRYYHEQSDDFFALGPVSIAFKPGEVVFLVGGNGSGKTTLAKLLVGLYPPEQGRIVLNGQGVDDGGRDQYRQLFSTVFSDFHLFDKLLHGEGGGAELDERGNRLIARLHLQHKVQVRDGAFTTQALSQGQRKRLALVVACLENRPFLVFDEWAADQDPLFKNVFYLEVLAELKAQGKTILVISHDDRYFHLADRLLRMENGQLSEDTVPARPAQPQAA